MEQPLGSRYLLYGLLGRGAMGQMFRGTVRGSGAAVAVKVLKPELVSDTEVVARFFRERSIFMSVDHPNVAKVLALVVEGDTLEIVMELAEGHDLRRYLRARGTLPPGKAVRLECQLLQGLAAVTRRASSTVTSSRSVRESGARVTVEVLKAGLRG
jgi:serine/threonine protein kinase